MRHVGAPSQPAGGADSAEVIRTVPLCVKPEAAAVRTCSTASSCFDLSLPLEEAAEGYRAMASRAIKTLLTP
jgi:hypothetical protein